MVLNQVKSLLETNLKSLFPFYISYTTEPENNVHVNISWLLRNSSVLETRLIMKQNRKVYMQSIRLILSLYCFFFIIS